MTTLQDAYKQHRQNQLLEASEKLAKKGVYSINTFLENHNETIRIAEKIEQLEEVSNGYQNVAPSFHMFVKLNTERLLEGKVNPVPVMINYAFICEALKYVHEAVRLVAASKHTITTPLYKVHGPSAVSLLEFCIKKASVQKLLESDSDQLIKNMALEFSRMPLTDLTKLCEAIPRMPLFVSETLHKELVQDLTVNDYSPSRSKI